MHQWGDESVDWNGIDTSAAFIGIGLRKWGRVDVMQYKEKFGTVRVYCRMGITGFHQLIWPGYVYNQFPYKWMWTADIYFPNIFWRVVNRWVAFPFHRWLYRRFYRMAVAKRPHLRKEILCAADYPEYLEGL